MNDSGLWIIGKGKAAFEIATQNPDELAPILDDDEVDNELLEYAPLEALEARRIKEDPRGRANRFPDDDPRGEPFDEETVASRFPKLASWRP